MMRNESPVFQAVAYPPTMIYIPVELAGANVGLNVAMMLVSMVTFDITPLFWLITTIIGHVVLMFVCSREPHLVMLMRCIGGVKQRSRNLIGTRNVKYVP